VRISETIARLQQHGSHGTGPTASHLLELRGFEPNPGNLRGLYHVPAGVTEPMPLVVVLHGCTQTAAGYDHFSGWSRLADRFGFMLLFPEQSPANNPNRCFNWFEPGDTRRGAGEAASIRQMIERLCVLFPVERSRIFCTGLSAGGAMASVMLAAYPELFAAGAIVAGLPHCGAANVNEALGFMHGRMRLSARALAENVRASSDHDGPWPRISVWHGTADPTVVATNGDDIVKQWLAVHDVPATARIESQVDGYPHRAWLNDAGETVVEQYVLTGIGHGAPLAPGDEDGQSGVAGPHMLNAGISSTDHIAAFFGLISGPAAGATRCKPTPRPARPVPAPAGVRQVIEDAFRAAGLMR
jgi:poly(hydroxyalkanoate) depolymerase family esterase